MFVLGHELAICLSSPFLVAHHALLVEGSLAAHTDFRHALHSLQSSGDVVPVVTDWNVSACGKL